MLKGIHPLLYPDLLKVLADMGHDDAIVFADANFTAKRYAAGKPVLYLPGIGAAQALQAVLTIFPLEAEVAHPVAFMQVSNRAAGYQSALQKEVGDLLQPFLLPHQSMEPVERFAFYERTQQAFAVVVTGELQPYGNFLLRKGVICDPLR